MMTPFYIILVIWALRVTYSACRYFYKYGIEWTMVAGLCMAWVILGFIFVICQVLSYDTPNP